MGVPFARKDDIRVGAASVPGLGMSRALFSVRPLVSSISGEALRLTRP